MLNNRITKQILEENLRGRGPAGKPRNRCELCVERCYQIAQYITIESSSKTWE
jgi:hypothetical protein